MEKPLAILMRPNKLNEVLGQSHLIGKNKILTNLINNNVMFSMILYGNPGVGKTTLAHVITESLNLHYRELNAVINNKKDFDIAIEEAKMYQGLIVIVDEIHRMNKDKQDILLPYLESGLIKLIGLTTSNPYHSINPAIRSRCQIFELNLLDEKDIVKGLERAVKSDYLPNIKINKEAIKYISHLASGDLRFAYNLLEMSYYSTSDYNVNIDVIKQINTKPVIYSDASGDNHYDLLSAFQKSIRGSDVDAALYYLGRLIVAGDFDSIYRRMTVIAYEDIGLANPSIQTKVDSVIRACERIGMPEARIPLSVVIIEMSLSPKSNTAYLALNNVLNDLNKGLSYPIPKHIKNNSADYLYPHDYKNGYVKQSYLPDNIKDKKYYFPKDNSLYESKLKEVYNNIKKMNS